MEGPSFVLPRASDRGDTDGVIDTAIHNRVKP
jgi:hypothetical protein